MNALSQIEFLSPGILSGCHTQTLPLNSPGNNNPVKAGLQAFAIPLQLGWMLIYGLWISDHRRHKKQAEVDDMKFFLWFTQSSHLKAERHEA